MRNSSKFTRDEMNDIFPSKYKTRDEFTFYEITVIPKIFMQSPFRTTFPSWFRKSQRSRTALSEVATPALAEEEDKVLLNRVSH